MLFGSDCSESVASAACDISRQQRERGGAMEGSIPCATALAGLGNPLTGVT